MTPFRTSENPAAAVPNLGTPAPAAVPASAPAAPPCPAFPAHEFYLLHLARRAGATSLSPEDREDLLQEMRIRFARAWEAADHTQPADKVRGYCATAARTAASNWHRARRSCYRIPPNATTSLDEPLPSGEGSRIDLLPAPSAANLHGPDEHRAALRALHTLPAAHRSIIIRHYLHGETLTDIGATLSLTRARISQIHRSALRTLHRALTCTLTLERKSA